MGRGFKFHGRNYKRILTVEEIGDIKIAIYKGLTEEEIRSTFQITRMLYLGIYQTMMLDIKNTSSAVLGHKNESYYTEEELLKGIPQYTFDELSQQEKEFYLNYNL